MSLITETAPSSKVATWTESVHAPHPQASEILRQVDYYFSEENLVSDPYLLGFTGKEGTNPVSLSLIMGFKKMKQFRPKTAVREVLKHSTVVEVVDTGHIRRRYPLGRPLLVKPLIDVNRYKKALAENQHLTKGMLKPTGFEKNAVEGPIRPEEYEEDRKKYDPEESFVTRIELAVTNFCARRKMHQGTRKIFTDLLHLGGFSNVHQFQGMSKKEQKRQGVELDDIADFKICDEVENAYYAEWEDGEKGDWVVDFESLAKSFLSDVFLREYPWYDEQQVKMATMVLRNFYNYLLLHNVCPEYEDQLEAARMICDVAETELPKLAMVDQSLPGAFNSACSTLCGGSYTDVHISQDGWASGCDNMGLSRQEAKVIIGVGVAAYGSREQIEKLAPVLSGDAGLKYTSSHKLGLVVVNVEPPNDYAKAAYNQLREHEGVDKYVHPMGKLHCKRWDMPFEPPTDLPKAARVVDTASFEFLVEESTLQYCIPGMKIEATIRELDVGLQYIDSIEATYPSFYTWLPNEVVGRWKEPGPPKTWMQRQQAQRDGKALDQVRDSTSNHDGGQDDGEFSDGGPD
ncbi:hypothetical protein BAUCODRAFT_311755 [Baudoinia panamericana UAMH 10762]|uniref:HTH La-type RNA-binding domain-containing protein n=1 Tax=Baudoinia panamericana (strain UAMH 10762) TaxID=717646 RepID=M2LDB2_BAUPA|nr:uncharacterized protein BAUCODRAFT_311755 [Baudoinia panamericana UAMH 10762]EMC91947.1 hypothetical protein BAUCODRAFT_311755 [Baudoinia panamericana UAMH 10762]